MNDFEKRTLLNEILNENEELRNFYNNEGVNPCKRLVEIIKYCNKNKCLSDNVDKNKIIQLIKSYLKKRKKHSKKLASIIIELNEIHTNNLVFEIYGILIEIKNKYSLSYINTLILNSKSILIDNDINYISSLIFSHEVWKKVIMHELKISFDQKVVMMKYAKFITNLDFLNQELLDVERIPIINLDEKDFNLNNVFTKQGVLMTNLEINIDNKLEFLYNIDFEKLNKEYNRDLNNQLRIINLRKIELENLLKKRKFTLKNGRNYYKIVNGLVYLFQKQNPTINNTEIKNIARMIFQDLFYMQEQVNLTTPNLYKVNNKVLMEYLLFLYQEKKFFTNKKSKIVSVVSKNLSRRFKGYSYKNLNIIFNDILKNDTFSFNKLALREKMNKK